MKLFDNKDGDAITCIACDRFVSTINDEGFCDACHVNEHRCLDQHIMYDVDNQNIDDLDPTLVTIHGKKCVGCSQRTKALNRVDGRFWQQTTVDVCDTCINAFQLRSYGRVEIWAINEDSVSELKYFRMKLGLERYYTEEQLKLLEMPTIYEVLIQ